jgi:hypothetical protein
MIARHAREISGRLAPVPHFAKFESRRNGNFLRTLRVMTVMQSRPTGTLKDLPQGGARSFSGRTLVTAFQLHKMEQGGGSGE